MVRATEQTVVLGTIQSQKALLGKQCSDATSVLCRCACVRWHSRFQALQVSHH